MQKDYHQADSEDVFWLFVCLFSSWVWQHTVEVTLFAWGVLWAVYNKQSLKVLLLFGEYCYPLSNFKAEKKKKILTIFSVLAFIITKIMVTILKSF